MLVDFRKLANITTPCQAIQIRRFRQSNIFLLSCLCVAESFLLVNNYQHTVFRNNHRREKLVPYQIYLILERQGLLTTIVKKTELSIIQTRRKLNRHT